MGTFNKEIRINHSQLKNKAKVIILEIVESTVYSLEQLRVVVNFNLEYKLTRGEYREVIRDLLSLEKIRVYRNKVYLFEQKTYCNSSMSIADYIEETFHRFSEDYLSISQIREFIYKEYGRDYALSTINLRINQMVKINKYKSKSKNSYLYSLKNKPCKKLCENIEMVL